MAVIRHRWCAVTTNFLRLRENHCMPSTHEQALTLARQGEFARARDLLQQLHAVNPGDTAILYDYALCVSEMGDKADSIPMFRHCTLCPIEEKKR